MLSWWWFLPLSGICRVPQTKWQLPKLYCASMRFLSVCIVLPFEGRHSSFIHHLKIFPFFQGRLESLRLPLAVWCLTCGLESLTLFPLRLFTLSLGSGTQLLAGGLSTMHRSSSSVCWMTSTRPSSRWEPSCGGLGTTAVSSAFHDSAFHLIIAYHPLLNSMMGSLITFLFDLYFRPIYTQLIICFLSNAPSNCSPIQMTMLV